MRWRNETVRKFNWNRTKQRQTRTGLGRCWFWMGLLGMCVSQGTTCMTTTNENYYSKPWKLHETVAATQKSQLSTIRSETSTHTHTLSTYTHTHTRDVGLSGLKWGWFKKKKKKSNQRWVDVKYINMCANFNFM